MVSPLLEIRHLEGPLPKPFNLQLLSAQIMTLTGASGTGKTRLLRAIADLDRVQGEVCLQGRARASFMPSEWRRQVAFVPAETAWWSDTVAPHFLADMPADMLVSVGFETDVMTWQVNRLSTGERQRLGLLRALVLQPKILLLDEPTANLDLGFTLKVEALVQAYLHKQKAAALWVTHDPDQRQRVSTSGTISISPDNWSLA